MPRRILYRHPSSKLVSWPSDWLVNYCNGGGDPCDMLEGPCACGAWHREHEWQDDPQNRHDYARGQHDLTRKIMGVPVFEFYNAEIRDYPDNPTREIMLQVLGKAEVERLENLPPVFLTLSYF